MTITAPCEVLRDAANRLAHVESERIRRVNTFMSIARRELGVTSNKEITQDDLDRLLATWCGGDRGLTLTDPLLDDIEKQATKTIESEVKDGPYREFVDERLGLGYKSFGRLLAVVGDPIYLTNGDPRTVGQLFQYSGVGDPEDKRSKGKKLRHNVKVGPRLHNIAETVGVKANGKPHYRVVYDEEKARKEGAVHTIPCSQCGSKSAEKQKEQKELDELLGAGAVRVKNDVKASVGTPWRPGHINGHGLRMVKREFLRDLWEEAHDLVS